MKKDINYYMQLPYITEVKKIKKEDGGGYLVSIPQLGKYAFRADGSTLEEAFENLENVKEFLFKKYIYDGVYIPEPKNDEENDYSGKFLMRIPKQLHRTLVENAKKENISLNQYVQFLLSTASVANTFENIIDNYNKNFERLLKDYKVLNHHYNIPDYNLQRGKQQELKIIITSGKKYPEAV